ncbi:PTS mannose/fructose/sorbose/N-acetylgalactosamine transporter subunit IIC, partial [Enterococcus faecalis]
MTLSIGIILILCRYTGVGVLDQISIQIGPYTPWFA